MESLFICTRYDLQVPVWKALLHHRKNTDLISTVVSGFRERFLCIDQSCQPQFQSLEKPQHNIHHLNNDLTTLNINILNHNTTLDINNLSATILQKILCIYNLKHNTKQDITLSTTLPHISVVESVIPWNYSKSWHLHRNYSDSWYLCRNYSASWHLHRNPS